MSLKGKSLYGNYPKFALSYWIPDANWIIVLRIRELDIIEYMLPDSIIDKYYTEANELKHILTVHSRLVAEKSLWVADRHPELNLDRDFLFEAAMLHDIGIFLTDAPSIFCFGDQPYVCHGYLGADLIRKEGFPRHALVCERHTGAGLSLEDIVANKLPIPHRNMLPQSLEEQVICFADKFYSKTHLETEKSIDKIRKSVSHFGEAGLERFNHWCEQFI